MKNHHVLCLAALALLGACHGESQDAANPAQQASSPTAPKPKPKTIPIGVQTRGMVSAVSPRKGTTDIELKFRLAERPVVGKPVSVELAMIAHVNAKNSALEISPGEGLTLSSGAAKSTIEDLMAESVYRSTVEVTPTSEGILFLNAVATFNNADFSESRNFSIPIIVGTLTAADDVKH